MSFYVNVYKADINHAPGSNSGASGNLVVFLDFNNKSIGYAGFAAGFIESTNTNSSSELDGNHQSQAYEKGQVCFADANAIVVPTDTIVTSTSVSEQYIVDKSGTISFGGVVEFDSSLMLEDSVVVIKTYNALPFGCLFLTKLSPSELLSVTTNGIDKEETATSVVTANVTSVPLDTRICFYGLATGLKPGLTSYTQQGTDCTATNGCGVHIHRGGNCDDFFDSPTEHLYNGSVLKVDPWLNITYPYTDYHGNARFAHCVETAQKEFVGKQFRIHENDGNPVSCGILQRVISSQNSSWDASGNDDHLLPPSKGNSSSDASGHDDHLLPPLKGNEMAWIILFSAIGIAILAILFAFKSTHEIRLKQRQKKEEKMARARSAERMPRPASALTVRSHIT